VLAVAAMVLCSGCGMPVYFTGYLTGAELDGKTRAEVIAQLGLPTAVSLRGDLLYAIRSAWYHYNDLQWVYRVVRFDAQGRVLGATPPRQTRRSVEALAARL
jgi:hypothetical protein